MDGLVQDCGISSALATGDTAVLHKASSLCFLWCYHQFSGNLLQQDDQA